MRHLVHLAALLVLMAIALPAPHSTAQEADTRAETLDRVHRARRLREFGYPLLARDQLELAKKLSPTSRELLLEYLRLYNDSGTGHEQARGIVEAALSLYPDDYELCLEIARLLFQAAASQPPLPPATRDAEQVVESLKRLDAEMAVYRELAAYIAGPGEELPPSARGKPGLSLAFLARCARATPSAEVRFMAGQELFLRGHTYHRWGATDEALEPFGLAGLELYRLAEPLFRACAGSETYAAPAAIYLLELLTYGSRHEDAVREAAAAELLSPGSRRIAEALRLIALETRDIALMVDAMTRLHDVYGDSTSELDLRIARRIKDKGWGFEYWIQYEELEVMTPTQRRQAIREVLTNQPEFIEIWMLDAINQIALALTLDNPDDQRRLREQALVALDRCDELKADFADWHRRRGLLLWELGRFDDSAESWKECARLSAGDNRAPRLARAATEIAAGKYTAAQFDAYTQLQEPGDFNQKRTALVALTRDAPQFAAAWAALSEICRRLGDSALAHSAAVRALETGGDNFILMETAAETALLESMWPQAVHWFERMQALAPDRPETERRLSLARALAEEKPQRREAWQLFSRAQRPGETESGRRKLLEDAVKRDGTLPDALTALAELERKTNPDRALRLLESAIANSRDRFTKAAAHRELGRLYAGARTWARAVAEFESAFAAYRSDGSDLLLAALALLQAGEHEAASAAMRKLFTEMPDTPLLRPREIDIHRLGLSPVRAEGGRRFGPAYAVGDKAKFAVQLEVHGEGGGQTGTPQTIGFDLRFEIVQTPDLGGLWVLRVQFDAPQSAELAGLAQLKLDLQISPWFGLASVPETGQLDDIVSPAIQALSEAFTCGLGDTMVMPPWVWRNTLTQGPPHFGSDDSVEAACVTQALGEEIEITRAAAAGREVGDPRGGDDTELTYNRGLEARVKLTGPRRALFESRVEIRRQELAPGRDDVIRSTLRVSLKLK